MTPILSCDRLTKRFGGLTAVNDLSFQVAEGRITALIGPNGAGKTTIFNLITRFLPADAGVVRFRGRELQNETPDRIARLGVARSFQDIRLFSRMSVLDNVMLGFPHQEGENLLYALFALQSVARSERMRRDRAREILKFVGLDHKAEVPAEELSYGQQKLLLIGRLMALQPSVLLLDEPCSGLDPNMLARVNGRLQELSDRGATILLIEHNMDVVRALAHYVVFLSEGRALAAGPTEEILADRALTKIYFGL
jgi:ABC-type branched-subunit amino acid transport system ATPase component